MINEIVGGGMSGCMQTRCSKNENGKACFGRVHTLRRRHWILMGKCVYFRRSGRFHDKGVPVATSALFGLAAPLGADPIYQTAN